MIANKQETSDHVNLICREATAIQNNQSTCFSMSVAVRAVWGTAQSHLCIFYKCLLSTGRSAGRPKILQGRIIVTLPPGGQERPVWDGGQAQLIVEAITDEHNPFYDDEESCSASSCLSFPLQRQSDVVCVLSVASSL